MKKALSQVAVTMVLYWAYFGINSVIDDAYISLLPILFLAVNMKVEGD